MSLCFSSSDPSIWLDTGQELLLDPTKLEHEAARNNVSKSSKNLCVEIIPIRAGPSEFQGNTLRDCGWYDNGGP